MLTHEEFQKIGSAVFNEDIGEVRRLLNLHKEAVQYTRENSLTPTFLHTVSSRGKLELVKLFVEMGSDINAHDGQGVSPPVICAIDRGHSDVVKFLVSKGADLRVGRPLIGAILRPPPHDLEFVKLLVEHGALINECYHPFDDKKQPQINPLSWAIAHGKHEIADYLRSKGATMPPGQKDPGPPTAADQIVAYFTEKLGPVQPQSQQEIVPTGLPIAIHLVPPSEGRNHITLFTTGMSEQPMTVPQGAEKMRYAELAINLPADWPIPGLNTGKRSLFGLFGKGKPSQEPPGGTLWPFQWLRTIARFPHDHGAWLGGPAVIFANGDPPEPLAPGLPFTSFLLMSTDETPLPNGEVVQIYQLLPLYTAERALEMAEGIPALLQALDRNNISWVVDPARPNVGLRRK